MDDPATIRTARLELRPISAGFADAVRGGDRDEATRQIGAVVTRWLTNAPEHVIQLRLGQANAPGMPALGRVVVLNGRSGIRRVIGSIGFHGPPDERGRLEIGCRLHPAYRRRGLTAEAMVAMFQWALERYGVSRFLVSLSTTDESSPRLASELGLAGDHTELVLGLERVLETEWPPSA